MNVDKIIGALIKEKRNKKKYSLRYASELLGKSKSTISYYESGRIPLDISMLKKMCNAYSCDFYDFLDEIIKELKKYDKKTTS